MFRFREWSIKWRIMVYFFLFSILTAVGMVIGFDWFLEKPVTADRKIGWIVFLVLLGQVVGYIAARHIQRGVDTLQLAMMELSKGNYKNRIDFDSGHSFQLVYHTFNKMAGTLEERISLIQKVGWEQAEFEQERIEKAVAEERKRLARDLHDTVSQELFAIHMSASSLPKVMESNPQAVHGLMEQMIQLSHHAQKQMRGLISQLRPIELEDQTLEEALDKWFPEYCKANRLQGELDIQLENDMSEVMEHQFFLMIQEAMANVVKHASASRVRLSLREFPHQYTLQLDDNGKGFDKRAISPTSHGLSTMRERAQKLGGDAQIISRLEAGTRVIVQIPRLNETTDSTEKSEEDKQ